MLLPLLLPAVAIGIALAMLIPLFFVVAYTIATGWDVSYQLLVRPRVGELLFNTVRLTIGVAAASAVIGTSCAWLTERSDLPWRSAWRALLVAPLAVPSFVNSFAWISLTHSVEGFGGAVLVVTLSHFPFVYLPVAAALRGIDPAMEETARSLGRGPWRTFLEVVLPQLRPALFGGLLIVTLHLLAELGALEMLRFPTFTTAIYDQFQSTFNSAAANMLAAVLVVACLLALVCEQLLRGRTRYARVGSGVARLVAPAALGRSRPLALGGLVVLLALALGVPFVMLGFWLRTGSSTAVSVAVLRDSALASAAYGGIGALASVVLALPVAWLAVRRPSALSVVTERATYVAHALPGIVVALSLVSITLKFAQPLYQSVWLLLTAYVILFFPLALVSIRAALGQVPPVLDDVGRSLGASPISVLLRVTVPLIWPGLGAGAALVFIAVATELTASLLLSPIGTVTLATKFWSLSENISYGAAAPYAALMVAISAPATLLLTRQAGRTPTT
ncbi:MAG: iron ABC transporter permease [Chloroflexota bacterium]